MESLEQIKVLIEELLTKEGYSLYSLKLNRGKNLTLEIVINRDAPIGFDDIGEISSKISKLLKIKYLKLI